jgi:hypothetical protein
MTMREMVEAAIHGSVQDVCPSIPNDISVVGLATPEGSKLTNPASTALNFPARSMAYLAGNILFDHVEEADSSIKQILQEPSLTVQAGGGLVRRNRTQKSKTPQRKDLPIRSHDDGTKEQKGGE